MKGEYIGKDKKFPEAHTIWKCPYCEKITFQDRWGKKGITIIKEVLGCEHWLGTEDDEPITGS